MGCDIHSYAERKTEAGYEHIEGLSPFDWRSYGMYAFLAGVRNYSAVTPISKPRGAPDDISAAVRDEMESWASDGHNHSWLSVQELAAFDYGQMMEDRRVTVQVATNSWNGGATCDPGKGVQMTVREFLGNAFFDDIEKLKAAGADRIVFWFDN